MTSEAGVALAEGYTETGSGWCVSTRKFNGVTDGAHDYPVQPGDTIYVLERFF
jgi:polysaccharide biosynthesis/export protein